MGALSSIGADIAGGVADAYQAAQVPGLEASARLVKDMVGRNIYGPVKMQQVMGDLDELLKRSMITGQEYLYIVGMAEKAG